ncbi:sterol desaturase family protein [Spirosoma fluminis]
MMEYFQTFLQGYGDYASYLFREITQPGWPNYFYTLVGISLLVWVLELLFPWRRNQPIFREGFWLDTFYLFFNYFLFSLIAYNAISQVGVKAFSDFLGLFGIKNIVALNVASLPGWAQLLLLFVVRDFIQWNVHRLLHHSPWLWQFHKVHHSTEVMGYAAHFRYHWMETIVYRTLEYIPLAMIGFGLQEFFIVHLFTLAIGHLNHANMYLPIGPLRYVFNSPQMHLWHHAEDLPAHSRAGINFGITLSLWDYVFGTAHVPYEKSTLRLGFPGSNQVPNSFFGQMVYPWRSRARKQPEIQKADP